MLGIKPYTFQTNILPTELHLQPPRQVILSNLFGKSASGFDQPQKWLGMLKARVRPGHLEQHDDTHAYSTCPKVIPPSVMTSWMVCWHKCVPGVWLCLSTNNSGVIASSHLRVPESWAPGAMNLACSVLWLLPLGALDGGGIAPAIFIAHDRQMDP